MKWRPVVWGTVLQFVFGLVLLRWNVGRQVIGCFGNKISIFLDYSNAGSGFVYGYLVTGNNPAGIPLGTVFVFKVIAKTANNLVNGCHLTISLFLDTFRHIFLQFFRQHTLLLWCYAMDCTENWMDFASLCRYNGCRIYECRCNYFPRPGHFSRRISSSFCLIFIISFSYLDGSPIAY